MTGFLLCVFKFCTTLSVTEVWLQAADAGPLTPMMMVLAPKSKLVCCYCKDIPDYGCRSALSTSVGIH